MLKAKKYDWKDSNMALFGSDTEKKVKKESAESEPAWKNAGQEVGQKIWRINKFKVEAWPEEDYGKFYEGDSYIILNTYKEGDSDELNYDVHFWIGKYSTQDEYGTAAYKTVELDTFLDDKPIQHREVQGHESNIFKSYFKDSITYMKGGADTGFRRVLPEEYKPRLFIVKKDGRRLQIREIAMKKSNLNSGDVFILDTGTKFYQWVGNSSSHDEKFKAAQELTKLIHERKGRCTKEVLEEDETSESHPFFGYFENEAEDDDDDDDGDDITSQRTRKLFKVSDADGSLDMDLVSEGSISRDNLCSDDVFVIDVGDHVYVWVGKGASIDERKNGMAYATNYINKTDYPWLPVSVVAEGQKFVIPQVA